MENSTHIPLAEQMRPTVLSDVLGQSHVTEVGAIIHQIVEQKTPTSLILWGPPGCGKTTLARIIARDSGAECVEISAVMDGKADIKKAIELGQQNLRLGQKTIVFVDEIHRFNKAQQDAFLPHVETGTIILIGATTENPSFEVITPLLSRSRVIVLRSLSKDDVVALLKRTQKHLNISAKTLPVKSIDLIADVSGGDARRAISILELAIRLMRGKTITPEVVLSSAQTKLPSYDKKGDGHYDTISAFIKSMRGGDLTATLYYLARMVQSGEDPKFLARRMVVFASEDIGLAGNGALSLAVATFEAVSRVGYPEANYALFHCASALCKSAKSRGVSDAMKKAMNIAKDFPDTPIPLHLHNAPTKLMGDLGYSDGTKWESGFVHPKGFMPPEIKTKISIS
jgi:putative ATPase